MRSGDGSGWLCSGVGLRRRGGGHTGFWDEWWRLMTQDLVSEEMGGTGVNSGKLRLFMPERPSFLRKWGPSERRRWGYRPQQRGDSQPLKQRAVGADLGPGWGRWGQAPKKTAAHDRSWVETLLARWTQGEGVRRGWGPPGGGRSTWLGAAASQEPGFS